MKNRKMLLPALLSIALAFSLILPASVLNMTSVMAQEGIMPMVAAGEWHVVGLKSDGTVVAVGWNTEGQCDIDGWTDIKQVAAGALHTVGVKNDGTVVAVGYNGGGECNVGGWADVV